MSSASETQLYLVRHGESTANARNVLQGKTIDEPLSRAGRQQAQAAAEALRRLPVARVYSSGLLRARETAEAIAEPHDQPVVTLDRLHEVDVGHWAGRTWSDIQRESPDSILKDYSADSEFATPGGESYRNVLDRVRPVFHDLLSRHAGETIVVVAHNVVNRVFLAELLGIPLRQATVIRQTNGAINLVRFTPPAPPAVMMLNSHLHL